MTTQTVNWCTDCQLECGASIPTTAYICVSADIVNPSVTTSFGFVTATITQVRASTCSDKCGPCKWVYTLSYDDAQLVDGFTIGSTDIKGVLCSDCLTDFILNNGGTPGNTLCNTYVTTYTELVDAIDSGASIVVCSEITLEANVTLDVECRVAQGGMFITDGFTLTIAAPFTSSPHQCFDSAVGEVVFANGTVCDNLYFEWFGAQGDAATDDTVAIQKTIYAARVNTGGVGNIPIQALTATTYMMSSVLITAFTVIKGSPIEKSASTFRCNTALSTMFILDGTAGFVQNIRFEGLYFDCNDLAAGAIQVKNAGLFECVDCQFIGGNAAGTTVFVLLDEGAIWNWFRNCEFVGNYLYGVICTGVSCNQNTIRDCHFSGNSCTHAIHTDSNWAGDTFLIQDCAMEAGGTDNMVLLDHKNNGVNPDSAGNRVTISGCRFDRTCTTAHINIQRFVWGVLIENCRMVDPVQFNVITAGRNTTVRDCFLGNSTVACIRLTVNSFRCHIGPNVNAGSALFVEDLGGTHENWIFRKTLIDTTLARPTDMQPCEQGYLYLDTTLDPDGKPIWWTGVAWVDATGAVV